MIVGTWICADNQLRLGIAEGKPDTTGRVDVRHLLDSKGRELKATPGWTVKVEMKNTDSTLAAMEVSDADT